MSCCTRPGFWWVLFHFDYIYCLISTSTSISSNIFIGPKSDHCLPLSLTYKLMLLKLDDMTLHCWLKVILTAQWCPMWQLLISSGCWLKFVSLVTNPLLDWLARSCFVVLMPVNDANCLMMSQQVLKPTSQQDNVIITIKIAIYCPQGSGTLRQQSLMMHWLCIECKSMPEYARVCQGMPEYARVC